MKLELDLSKDDYLQHQLYRASKRKTIKTQKIRNAIIFSILAVLLGTYGYMKTENVFFIILFGVILVIDIFTYPLYLRILYKRHFSKFINENYNDKIGKIGSLEIIDKFIFVKDVGSESEYKIDIKEIREIVEIQTNYFLITGNIASLILLKKTETNNFINILVNNYDIKLNKELNWKWK